jgi:hypothetical protein
MGRFRLDRVRTKHVVHVKRNLESNSISSSNLPQSLGADEWRFEAEEAVKPAHVLLPSTTRLVHSETIKNVVKYSQSNMLYGEET